MEADLGFYRNGLASQIISLDLVERPPQDTNTATPDGRRFFAATYRTVHFFSYIFAKYVGHSA